MNRRRQFLLGGLGLVGLLGLGLWGFGRTALEGQIVAALRRRLDYLRLDDDGLHAFARDQAAVLLAKRPSLGRLRYHLVAAVGPSFARFYRSTDKRTRLERMEDSFAATYLMSSDFFFHGADESRPVRYVNFYDATLHPCSNPFARPVQDTAPRG